MPKATEWRNKLFYGDNLAIMREHVENESVDLIYLDPPFNSKADYNVLFKNKDGSASGAQAEAFKDSWEWDEAAAAAYHELMTSNHVPAKLRDLMGALKVFLTGDTGRQGNGMMAYLTMMALRLVELHRILKPSGSLYLHCDPTASHYIKMILDAVFGFEGFKNEIIWNRHNARSTSGKFPQVHDTLLLYSKGKPVFHEQDAPADERRLPHTLITGADGKKYQTYELTGPGVTKKGQSGKPWRGFDPTTMGRHWANSHACMDQWDEHGLIHWPKPGKSGGFPRRRAEEPFDPTGRRVTVGSFWGDIDRINQSAKERLGYPTQKPEALLERILLASSNEGDVVLDPFCGCGTTIAVAERLGRRWIGIDVTYVAVDLMERRLIDMFTPESVVEKLAAIPVALRRKATEAYWAKGDDLLMLGLQTGLSPYEVIGDPKDFESAKFLAENDKYQFEWWAIRMLGAQGKEEKKGTDRGIDGIISFMDGKDQYKKAVVSVKGGAKTPANAVRDLRGTMEREGAVSGILVTLNEPTKAMKKEVADAGRWESDLHPEKSFPVLQIVTAQDLVDGKMLDLPAWTRETGARAKRVRKAPEQPPLPEEPV